MSTENRISVQIPSEQLAQVQTKVNEIKQILMPYLIALTGSEIRGLFKMNDRTIPFVEKCLSYAKTNPKFLPPYVDINELEIDFSAVSNLSAVYRPLNELSDNLSDTITLSGSEALSSALAYYNSVKHAVKQNVPEAKTIYEDLKKRFEKSSSANSNTPEAPKV
jgi:DNA-binding protein Fis